MHEDMEIVPVARHEQSDIGEGFVWGLVAAGATMLTVCSLLILWMYPKTTLDRVLDRPLPIYPAPRLQPDPAADMAAMRARELHRLDSVGWSDRERGSVHIPIALAMQKLAAEGIPGWPPAVPTVPASPESGSP